MLIEHRGLLSWVLERRDGSKKQKPCQDCRTLIGAGDQRPAILPWFSDFGWRPSFRVIRAPCPLCPAAGLLLDCQSARKRRPNAVLAHHVSDCLPSTARTRRARSLDQNFKSTLSFETAHENARRWRAWEHLATNVVLLEQRLVTRFVPLLEVVEQRAARRDQLQEATTRMVVLHVGLEMVRQVVDAFRQDRDLNLRRAVSPALLAFVLMTSALRSAAIDIVNFSRYDRSWQSGRSG